MELERSDLKFNFGCACQGYKTHKPGTPLGTIPINRVIEKLDEHFACNDMDGAGRLLDYWRQEAVSLHDHRGELTVVSEQIGYFRKTANEERAMEAVQRALVLLDAQAESVATGTIFLNAATTLKAFGKAQEALPLYERAFDIYKAHLEENDRLFAGYYNNYGLALGDLGHYAQAEDCYRKALEIVLDRQDSYLDGAITYLNMAQMYPYWDEKSPQDIKDCLLKAQTILLNEQVERNGYYAFVLSKCAPTFREFGKTELAEKLEQMSEAIYAGNRTV